MTEFIVLLPEIWVVVADHEEWESLTGVDAEDGPQEYPCSVMRMEVNGDTVYAVMHVDAAAELCQEAGMLVGTVVWNEEIEDEDE